MGLVCHMMFYFNFIRNCQCFLKCYTIAFPPAMLRVASYLCQHLVLLILLFAVFVLIILIDIQKSLIIVLSSISLVANNIELVLFANHISSLRSVSSNILSIFLFNCFLTAEFWEFFV